MLVAFQSHPATPPFPNRPTNTLLKLVFYSIEACSLFDQNRQENSPTQGSFYLAHIQTWLAPGQNLITSCKAKTDPTAGHVSDRPVSKVTMYSTLQRIPGNH